MSPRLADRLEAARRRRFAGRQAECALFAAALAGPELPNQVLCVFGPCGVGTTSLLREFGYPAQQRGIRAVYLDVRDNVLMVLAGRQATNAAWRSDPGWQDLVRLVPLRNLAPAGTMSL